MIKSEIERLLDSDLSSSYISKNTGVEQSTIYRLRKGERNLENLGLKQCERLNRFAINYFKRPRINRKLLKRIATYYLELNEHEEFYEIQYIFLNKIKSKNISSNEDWFEIEYRSKTLSHEDIENDDKKVNAEKLKKLVNTTYEDILDEDRQFFINETDAKERATNIGGTLNINQIINSKKR